MKEAAFRLIGHDIAGEPQVEIAVSDDGRASR
jgi:hypothetical protein